MSTAFDNQIACFVGDAIVVVSPDKHLIYANPTARVMFGLSEGTDFSSRTCYDILRMTICESRCPSERLEGTTPVAYDYFVCQEGNEGVFCVTSSLFFDARGRKMGVIHSIKGMEMLRKIIEDQKKTEENLRLSRLKMQAILESIADGVFSVDASRKIDHFSRSMEAITGYREDEVLGKECVDVLRGGLCHSDCPITWGLKEGQRLEKSEEVIIAKDGRQIPVFLTISPVKGDNGVLGAVCSVHERTEVEDLRRELAVKPAFPEIVGTSPQMLKLFDLIESICDSDATVLIEGETGTGKELVARAIHGRSSRSRGPFVTVNCSALSPFLLESEIFGHARGAFTGAVRERKGKFETADGGTLFLDEVSEFQPETQVKLLRFLQSRDFERVGETETRKVDVRILAATNRKLQAMVATAAFRSDFYYRLNVIPVGVPPLRDRKEDLPLLLEHFIQKYRKLNGEVVSFSARALKNLVDYHWPGNVRELENVVMYAMTACVGRRIEREHLPPDLRHFPAHGKTTIECRSSDESLLAIEKRRIIRALTERNWRVSETALAMGYSRITLWRRMKKLNIAMPNKGP